MQHIVQRMRKEIGLPAYFTLDACRHGGLTELEEAELTDGQGRALSAHKIQQSYEGYARPAICFRGWVYGRVPTPTSRIAHPERVETVIPQPYTQLEWSVSSIHEIVEELGNRGILFEKYSALTVPQSK
jgi:hypothetical protein